MIDPEKYKNTADDIVIVNSDWSVVRLSGSLLAQKSAEEIRESLRQLYAGKYRHLSPSKLARGSFVILCLEKSV